MCCNPRPLTASTGNMYKKQIQSHQTLLKATAPELSKYSPNSLLWLFWPFRSQPWPCSPSPPPLPLPCLPTHKPHSIQHSNLSVVLRRRTPSGPSMHSPHPLHSLCHRTFTELECNRLPSSLYSSLDCKLCEGRATSFLLTVLDPVSND